MNPGKVVNPYHIDQNLRLGTDYRPPQVATHFKYPQDRNSFTFMTTRCVGVGECRREHGGTMCPSYRVTHDEQHSTRGRAHLLFEMMRGDPLDGGWRDEHVKDALDLCLSCKGCKSDCPVNVDMATYKAEFLSHYYEKRQRPAASYAMGFVHRWARLASIAPGLVNGLTHAPGLSAILKRAAGVSTSRDVPRFAPRTFVDWFGQHQRRNGNRRPSQNGKATRVILWADTFNNYFHPSVAIAATEVLEAANCDVLVPRQSVLLRSAAVRLWISDASQAAAPHDSPRPPAAPGCRHADRRAGAQLPCGVSRRAREPVPHR